MDNIIKKKGINRKLLVVILITFIAFFYLKVFSQPQKVYEIDRERVRLSEVHLAEFAESIPIYGSVKPIRSVFLDTVQGGIVEEIYVEEGQNVVAGQPLLKFKNIAFEMQIFSQEARVSEQLDINVTTRLSLDQNKLDLERELNASKLEVKLKERQLNRSRVLLEKGFIAEEVYANLSDEYEKVAAELKINQLALEQDTEIGSRKIKQLMLTEKRLESHLKVIRESMKQLIVAAPIDGYLTSIPVEVGEMKKSGERLGQIDMMGGHIVQSSIDSFYLSRVKKGQKATFVNDDQEQELEVIKIYPEITNGQFLVDFGFVNEEPQNIVRGQNFNLTLNVSDTSMSNVIKVGNFYNDSGGEWVFVLDESGRQAVKREVKFGKRNQNYIQVKEGLEVGESVIISSYANYQDKSILRIN